MPFYVYSWLYYNEWRQIVFGILRRADASDFKLLNVFNVLQSAEKTMIKQLFIYTLSSIHLHRYKSYFKLIFMIGRDINPNPRPITTIDNNIMWDDFTVIFLMTGLKIKLLWTMITQILLTRGVCLKKKECILFI